MQPGHGHGSCFGLKVGQNLVHFFQDRKHSWIGHSLFGDHVHKARLSQDPVISSEDSAPCGWEGSWAHRWHRGDVCPCWNRVVVEAGYLLCVIDHICMAHSAALRNGPFMCQTDSQSDLM